MVHTCGDHGVPDNEIEKNTNIGLTFKIYTLV